MRGGNGHSGGRCSKDSESAHEFDTEPPGGRDGGDIFAHRLDQLRPAAPQSGRDPYPPKGEQKPGRLLVGIDSPHVFGNSDAARVSDQVDGNERSNCVAHIVAAVRKWAEARRHDLQLFKELVDSSLALRLHRDKCFLFLQKHRIVQILDQF